jgi:hypothetical protein
MAVLGLLCPMLCWPDWLAYEERSDRTEPVFSWDIRWSFLVHPFAELQSGYVWIRSSMPPCLSGLGLGLGQAITLATGEGSDNSALDGKGKKARSAVPVHQQHCSWYVKPRSSKHWSCTIFIPGYQAVGAAIMDVSLCLAKHSIHVCPARFISSAHIAL